MSSSQSSSAVQFRITTSASGPASSTRRTTTRNRWPSAATSYWRGSIQCVPARRRSNRGCGALDSSSAPLTDTATALSLPSGDTVEDLPPVATPHWRVPSPGGNLLLGAPRKRLDVDLLPAGLVRSIDDPTAVGRKAGRALGERGSLREPDRVRLSRERQRPEIAARPIGGARIERMAARRRQCPRCPCRACRAASPLPARRRRNGGTGRKTRGDPTRTPPDGPSGKPPGTRPCDPTSGARSGPARRRAPRRRGSVPASDRSSRPRPAGRRARWRRRRSRRRGPEFRASAPLRSTHTSFFSWNQRPYTSARLPETEARRPLTSVKKRTSPAMEMASPSGSRRPGSKRCASSVPSRANRR